MKIPLKVSEEVLLKNNLKFLEYLKDSYVLVENKYGICKVRREHVNKGIIPTIQSSIDKNSYFSKQSIEKYGDIFNYSKVNYINNLHKVILECKTHGEFLVPPNAHFHILHPYKYIYNCVLN